MKRKAQHSHPIAVCTFKVLPGGEVQLFPSGEFTAPRGSMLGTGPWKTDVQIAAAFIAEVSKLTNDIVIDYEHQTLSASENGKESPAAGWVNPRSLEWREGEGIFAAAKWTDKAKAYIDADEYRYLSPVFSYNRKSGAVLNLFHIGLVNVPAIDGMDSVSALAAAKFGSTQSNEEPQMKELLKLFGLAADASEDEAVAALKALQQKNTELQADLTKKDEAIAAAKAATPDDAVTAMKALQTEVAALKVGNQEREVSELVETALADGKLLPAQKDWATGLGQTDIAALKSYIETAQPIAALKGNQTKGKKPGGLKEDGELTDEAIAVCKQMDIDPKEYKKTLEEESST